MQNKVYCIVFPAKQHVIYSNKKYISFWAQSINPVTEKRIQVEHTSDEDLETDSLDWIPPSPLDGRNVPDSKLRTSLLMALLTVLMIVNKISCKVHTTY